MLDPIVASIITGVVISIIGGVVIALINRKWKKRDQEKYDAIELAKQQAEDIDELQKDTWKLKKTLLIVAKILDDQTAKNHSELTSSLEDIANELLKQSEKS
jgi:H+/gluconate symporter-like permease